MNYILYLLMGVYFLPLLGVGVSCYISAGFTMEKSLVYFVNIISSNFMQYFREAFASLLMPFVTAYAVKIGSSDQLIPKSTKILISVLILLFIVSSILFTIIQLNQEHLEKFGQNIFKVYNDITSNYAKEALAYTALTLGVSLKK